MSNNNAVIAVFTDHQGAEAAVKKLADAGIDIKHLSVVGKGYHTDEKLVGWFTTPATAWSSGASAAPSSAACGAGSSAAYSCSFR